MPGVKALRKIQLGVETTSGTAVVATAVWRGEGVLKDEQAIEAVKEDVGFLVSQGRTYSPMVGATLEMDDTPATFEQLPYILAAGIENIVTGVADSGSGTGKIYEYNFPTTAANTTKTYTIEAGDDQRVDEMEYAFVEEFTLSGAKGEAVEMSAKWRGRQASDAEFTGAIAVPAVEEILFQKGKLYINDGGGTIGNTQKTSTWLGFKLTVKTGLQAMFTGDGNLYFTATKNVGYQAGGVLTLEHDTTGEAEITAARAESVRLVRMLFEGSTLTTAGAYSKKTLKIDMAIKYTEVPQLDDDDGDDVVSLPFEVVYSTADVLGASIIVVNSLTALV